MPEIPPQEAEGEELQVRGTSKYTVRLLKNNREDRSHVIKRAGHGGVHLQCQHRRVATRLSGQ